MNKTASFLAALALAVATAAAAKTVQYQFTVTIDTQGLPISGQSFLGSLAYDDQAAGVIGPGGETLLPLTDFSFDFDQVYNLASLSYGDAAVDGGAFAGIDVGAQRFAFLPGLGGAAPFFAFDLGRGVAGNGSIDFREVVAPVSEPLTLALIGLAAAGMLRRRRQP